MSKIYSQTFEWHFDQPPHAMWDALADTARFNEAAQLPKHEIEEDLQEDGSVRFYAKAKKGPIDLAWEEVPVEWVDQQWFRHIRLFSKGPLKRLSATLRLESDGKGGTIGHYTLAASAANLFGILLLNTGFFPSAKKSFTSLTVCARDWAAGERDTKYDTGSPPTVERGVRERLRSMLGRIESTPNGHGLSHRLADWLLSAQEIDLQAMRPLVLARMWQASERQTIEMCLQAVKEGMLELRWDLLCPRCRGPKLSVTGLDQLPRGAHCDACNIDYDRDFAANVELTFHPAPAIRRILEGEFCLFGPMTTPHVKLQIGLEAGEERDIEAQLEAGDYRVRTLEFGGETEYSYDGGPFASVFIARDGISIGQPSAAGTIHAVNKTPYRRTLIIEERNWIHDALTAHRVTSMQAFRDLFSEQVLRPGDEVAIAQVTLMFTDLKNSTALYEHVGDANAYHLIRDHFAFLSSIVRNHDGCIVKTIGDAVMASFSDPADAVRAAIEIQQNVDSFNRSSDSEDIIIKLGLHGGPCIAVTLNDRLDYFGGTINLAARLQDESQGNDIILSGDLINDPVVAELVTPYAVVAFKREIKGFDEPVIYHIISEIDRPAGKKPTAA